MWRFYARLAEPVIGNIGRCLLALGGGNCVLCRDFRLLALIGEFLQLRRVLPHLFFMGGFRFCRGQRRRSSLIPRNAGGLNFQLGFV